MRSAGLFTGSNAQGDHPIMDGKRHRVPVEGGKKGTLDGFYVGHLDGHPAGRIINNKTGTDITWKSKGYALSEQEKAKLQAEAAEKLAQRDRKSVVEGKSVPVRLDLGGSRIYKKKNKNKAATERHNNCANTPTPNK